MTSGMKCVAVRLLCLMPSSGAVRRGHALDRGDHHDDHSRLFANLARLDGSAGQCLGLCRLILTETRALSMRRNDRNGSR